MRLNGKDLIQNTKLLEWISTYLNGRNNKVLFRVKSLFYHDSQILQVSLVDGIVREYKVLEDPGWESTSQILPLYHC